METFKKNLDVLKKTDPILAGKIENTPIPGECRVIDSRKGHPVLRVGKITLHSAYDPLSEGDRIAKGLKIVDGISVVVLGLGFAYHVESLLKRMDQEDIGGCNLVVVEPRLDVLKSLMERRDITDLLERISLFAGMDAEEIENSGEFHRQIKEGVPLMLRHKTSMMLSSNIFKGIEEYLTRITAREEFKGMRLRIMVVSPIMGGSLPIYRYCVKALRDMGHTVLEMDNSRFNFCLDEIERVTSNENLRSQLRGFFSNFLSELFIAQCVESRPDLVFALAQAPMNPSAYQRLKQLNIPSAFWFVEDFRLFPYWKEIAPHLDYFFTIQKGDLFEELDKKGIKNYHYLPHAFSPDVHKGIELTQEETEEFGSDISFVGAGYYNRHKLFSALLDYDFRIWGSYWVPNSEVYRLVQRDGAWVNTEDTVKVFNATKINLNLHSSTFHEGVNPVGDFVNPRTFELAGSGCFQIVDRRSLLGELFEEDEEIVCYSNLSELRGKINYYLSHPEEREKIASKARRRALRDHTHVRRMEEMLELIIERDFYRFSHRVRGKGKVDLLIEEAGEDKELVRFLERFKDRDSISLSDIVEEIKKGKGKLSEVETIFMLMNQLWEERVKKRDI